MLKSHFFNSVSVHLEKHTAAAVMETAGTDGGIASDQETIITAMERASVLFDRFVIVL